MKFRLSQSPRLSPVPAMLVLNAVLLVLLALAILATPAPGIQATFGGATVDISADSAWVWMPQGCVNIKWDLEGIQSLYVDGKGKVGYDEMTFCPTTDVSSPNFEITARNGESRIHVLNIRYLPAATVSCLALLALLLPFLTVFYYLATMRLVEPLISDLSPLLTLAELLLVCLLIQTAQPFTIDDVLDGLENVFSNQSWYLIGWVMAGLVFIPLAMQSLWQRWRSGFRADFIVIGSFLALILLLYLPFGFDFIWHREEWFFQALLEGRESKAEREVAVRFWLLIQYPFANVIEVNPIIFHHIFHVAIVTVKLVLLYGIARKFGVSSWLSYLFAIFVQIYPVNFQLMSTRNIILALNMMALLAAVYLLMLFLQKPSRLRLLGILLALFFHVGTHEGAYAIVLFFPILWWWRSPRWTWRNINLTGIWYLIPAAKVIYTAIRLIVDRPTYGMQYLHEAAEQERPFLESLGRLPSAVGEVYHQTFIRAWDNALVSLAQNAWMLPTLAALLLVGMVAVYTCRISKESRIPSRRQLFLLSLGGILFILASIAVLLWFERYQYDLWRLYTFVPIGAAAVTISVLLMTISPIKNLRLRQAAIVGLLLMLMFPALSRLFVQQAHMVKNASAIEKVLSQIVEQAPYFDANATLVLVTSLSMEALKEKRLRPLWTNTFDSAIYMLYEEGRPKVSFMCRLRDHCNKDDISIKEDYLERVTDYSEIVMFRLYDDLGVVLLRELPAELDGPHNNTYNPDRLIDTSAPIPSRALTLLTSVYRDS